MRPVALIAFDPSDAWRARLATAEAPEGLEFAVTREEAWIRLNAHRIEVLAGSLPTHLLRRATGLRWVHNWGSGVDRLLDQLGSRCGAVVITNCTGIHRIPIAEHVLASMLGFARASRAALASQASREWRSHGQLVFELSGKTILIVGLGAVGSHLARLCQALGMRVLGIRKDVGHAVVGQIATHGIDDLPQLLPDADFVVSLLPLTSETENFFALPLFSQMKPSAYFINVGRGGSVVEGDLIVALETNVIAGAAIDVVRDEPLPHNSLLWDAPNLVITAHYAGSTPLYDDRAFEIFKENLRVFPDFGRMKNIISSARGY